MQLKEYLRIMFNPSLVVIKIKSEILRSSLEKVNKTVNDELIITNKHKENMAFVFDNVNFDEFFKEDYKKFKITLRNFVVYVKDKKIN